MIRRFCAKLGIVHVLASQVDPKTGRYTGLNCHGEEKVRRLKEVEKNADIEEFYSDSISDAPLAALAEKAYLVKGDQRRVWPQK
jgi:phosphoserine phosphatase